MGGLTYRFELICLVKGRGSDSRTQNKNLNPVYTCDVWMRGEGLDGRTNMFEQKNDGGGSGGSSILSLNKNKIGSSGRHAHKKQGP